MNGLLGIRQTGSRLGLSEHTIRHWIKNGRLEHIRLGKRIVFDPKYLEKLIDSHRIKLIKGRGETILTGGKTSREASRKNDEDAI